MASERKFNPMLGVYEYTGQHPQADPPKDWIIDALRDTLIDPEATVEKPPVLFSIMDIEAMQFVERRVFTLGNFSTIIGKAKSKKTFLLSAISAAIISQSTLWKKFRGHKLEKNKVLYFDTEQGTWDAWNVIRRICTMAGDLKQENFRAWTLRQFTPVERCEIIEFALSMHGNETAFVVIDGIADLANAINDEDEATRVTTLLLRWSKEYNLHIATVIHQNKNDNYATGHLGSSIMKKCEIILSVEKDSKDYRASDVKCDMSRGMEFKEFRMVIGPDGLPTIDDVPHKEQIEFFDESKINEDVPY